MQPLRVQIVVFLLGLAVSGHACAREHAAHSNPDNNQLVFTDPQRSAIATTGIAPPERFAPAANLAVPVGSVMVGVEHTAGAPTSAYDHRVTDDGRVELSFGYASVTQKHNVSSLVLPLTWARITSGFGFRIHPITGRTAFHSGVDLAAAEGTPVVAAQSGRVTFASYDGGYGNVVRIAGSDGISTLYGHLSGFAVHEGSDVRAGQTIGFVGSTGSSTGPHLHFELRSDGHLIDPVR